MEVRRHNRIESLAREIYGLVWANRDDEADKRLRRLGPDLVPVAHALVKGNFRWPPLLLRLGVAGQWLMLFGPVLVPVIYSTFWNLPFAYSGYKWAFYFGLAGGTVMTELLSALFVPWLVNHFGFVKMREYANQRKLDLASVARIAKHGPSVTDPQWAPLVQCAAELLPQLEDNYRRFQGKEVLLRSSAPAGSEPTLLRASSEPSETPEDELLRAVE
jgi:hypothetical protein